MLKTVSLSVAHGRRTILQDVDLEIRAGEFVVVLGRNGAGKSTLLKALSGELKPSRGEVTLEGRPLCKWGRLPLARTRAVLPQTSALNFPLPVREVVQLGRHPHEPSSTTAVNQQVVQEAMELTGVDHLATRRYTTLSGGERQRVNLARALAQIWPEPGVGDRLLLLDEPTSALDIAHVYSTLALVHQVTRQGVGALAILHDLNAAARFADRVVVLHEGRVEIDDLPCEVFQVNRLRKVFGLEAVVSMDPETRCPTVLPLGPAGEIPACPVLRGEVAQEIAS